MFIPSFSDAYFNSAAYYTSAYEYELPISIDLTFPLNSSTGDWFNIYSADFMNGDQNTQRTYNFSYQSTYGEQIIYKCTITSYDGDALDPELVESGTFFTYVSVEYIYGGAYESVVDIRFIERSNLPGDLDYDFLPSDNSDLGIIYTIYSLGSDVVNFFPKLDQIFGVNVAGYSFFDLLISGFSIYCGFVIVKWVVGIVV